MSNVNAVCHKKPIIFFIHIAAKNKKTGGKGGSRHSGADKGRNIPFCSGGAGNTAAVTVIGFTIFIWRDNL